MKYVDWVSKVLVLVGALNWGLVGAFDFNLVEVIFGVDTTLTTVVYVLVGLAALYEVYVLVARKAE